MSSRTITSLANPTVKSVRALHMRKEREATGLFLAEGLKIVTEAVELGHAPRYLLHGPDAADHPLTKAAAAKALANGGEVLEVNRDILEKVSRKENPQAVVGVFRQAFTPLSAIEPASAPCWVALEAVRDPGNLGTIIRTADAAGCGGVILVGDCVDPYGVEAVRATMGSIFAVKIAKATIAEFLAWRQTWRGSVVGTLLTAKVDHTTADYQRPTLIVMGNEAQGMTPEMAAACDLAVKIPMRGRADSLNLSVATGIMIYAATA
ncbi:MAG: RNA methyltransferase [Caulobacterales bacterium 68-7]|nr:MAG: RNA methyltransferase [Caulobacterales bacterium 68-7]